MAIRRPMETRRFRTGTARRRTEMGELDAADGDEEAEEDIPSVCFGDLAVGQWEEFATGIDSGTEGIAFDGLGGLYVSNKQRVLRLDAEGNFVEFAVIPDAIGMAFDLAGDLFVCSLGEEFDKDTRDGALYRVDATGNVSTVLEAGTILNPNFITRTPWGSWLISDDLVPEIWEVGDDGQAALWTEQVASAQWHGVFRRRLGIVRGQYLREWQSRLECSRGGTRGRNGFHIGGVADRKRGQRRDGHGRGRKSIRSGQCARKDRPGDAGRRTGNRGGGSDDPGQSGFRSGGRLRSLLGLRHLVVRHLGLPGEFGCRGAAVVPMMERSETKDTVPRLRKEA